MLHSAFRIQTCLGREFEFTAILLFFFFTLLCILENKVYQYHLMVLSQITLKRNLKKTYNNDYYSEFVQLTTDDTSTLQRGPEWMLCYSVVVEAWVKIFRYFQVPKFLKIVLEPQREMPQYNQMYYFPK